jgi:hypothetical protein
MEHLALDCAQDPGACQQAAAVNSYEGEVATAAEAAAGHQGSRRRAATQGPPGAGVQSLGMACEGGEGASGACAESARVNQYEGTEKWMR